MKNPPFPLTLSTYQRRNRHAVRELLFRHFRVHTHLDWHETDEWLDSEAAPVRLAWQNHRLVGLMAASTPQENTCWVRLAAVHDSSDPNVVLPALWDDLQVELRAQGVETAALLMIRDWLVPFAPALGFRFVEEIVTLRRANQPLPPDMSPADLMIRMCQPNDLPTLAAVDQRAFAAPWQMTLSDLRQAEKISAICTVAQLNGTICGYQLSTLYFDGAHLARLAVLPDAQGRGVGGALLSDVLRRFARRGVTAMTVNTQSSNDRSQRLYQRFGFRHNGYNLPVWMKNLRN